MGRNSVPGPRIIHLPDLLFSTAPKPQGNRHGHTSIRDRPCIARHHSLRTDVGIGQGKPLPHLRSRKALWLLALLTLRRDRPVEREWLTGALWPDVDQDRAFRNLRVVLGEFAPGVGDEGERLQSPGRHTLCLSLTGARADVVTFDAAMAPPGSSGDGGGRHPISRYRGPLLEGCAEEWVPQERGARGGGCLKALRTLADAESVRQRLAIAVAAEAAGEFADGAWLVALESLSDGKLVAGQIAAVLGLKEEAGRPALQTLTDHLRQKRILLVLDNCEHLLEAGARSPVTCCGSARGRILATSREAMGITGEAVWRVPSLATPDPEHLPRHSVTLRRVLLGYESVRLSLWSGRRRSRISP